MLDRIIANKQAEVWTAKQVYPLLSLKELASKAPPVRDFAAALHRPGTALIAEVKRASPSRGELTQADPLQLALACAANGAEAISVLTDETFFRGSRAYLTNIRHYLRTQCPPLLRKDFFIDPYQIWQARADGADAVLLIVGILTDNQLKLLLDLTQTVGLAALVEVHSEEELSRALAAGATIIGVNNRNLQDFSVDQDVTTRLLPRIPAGITIVSESGIHSPKDVRRLAEMGVDAVLVGEALVTAPDVAAQVGAFVEAGRAAARRNRADTIEVRVAR